MWFIPPDTYVEDHTGFTCNGVQYDAKAMFDPALRAELGAVAVTTVGEYKDARFYVNSEHLAGSVRTISNTPVQFDLAKAGVLSEYRNNVNALLAQSDWEVIAANDSSRLVARPLPVATAEKRVAILTEFNRLEAAVLAATTVEQLAALVPNWPAI